MFRRKAKEAPRVIKDPKDFTTNVTVFLWLGYIYDGSLVSKFRFAAFLFLLYSAPVHHFLPVFLDKDITLYQIMTSLYLLQMYILLGFSWPYMIYRSNDIIEFGKQLRQGVFRYSVPYTESERRVLSETNDYIIRTTRLSLIVYLAAGLMTFTKELTPEGIRQFRPPFPGYFPWDINNPTGYTFAILYHLCLVVHNSYVLEANFLLFAFLTINFEGQFRLLTKHFVETFPPDLTQEEAHTNAHRQWTLERLKECVEHHLCIKRFHQMILRYFGVCLFLFRIISTIMLCIIAYLVSTNVDVNKLLQIFGLAAIILLLTIFCFRGEKVVQVVMILQFCTLTNRSTFIVNVGTVNFSKHYCHADLPKCRPNRQIWPCLMNSSEDWNQTVYGVEWWIQPLEVQKTLLLMQLGSIKPLTIFGIWKVAMFSHKGISVMGQETLGFFNMIRAMK